MITRENEPELYSFLSFLGYSQKKISEMDLETRLVHDLKCDGDSFDEAMTILQNSFGVDLQEMDWRRYNISEHEFLSLSRLWLWPRRKKRNLSPIPLGMIKDAIRSKKWSDH